MKFILHSFRAFLFIAGVSILFSCEEEVSAKKKLTYQVDLSDSVSISYYSDYYYASGTLKEILVTNQKGRNWSAVRFAPEKEKYYIKVKYHDQITDSSNYYVIIYSDDDILDSARVKSQEIVLEGEVE